MRTRAHGALFDEASKFSCAVPISEGKTGITVENVLLVSAKESTLHSRIGGFH